MHILPDLSAVFRRVASEQIGRVVCSHQLYGRMAQAGIIFVELPPQLAYRLGGIEQRPGGVSAEGYDYFGLDQFDLNLEVWQAGYYLVGERISIPRRTTLQNVAYIDIAAFKPTGCDNLIEQLARPSDEGAPLGVLIGARRLSDKHYPRIGIALAGNGISSQRGKAALATLPDFLGQFLKFSSLSGNIHIVLLFLGPARIGLALYRKAGEELLGLEMLANYTTYSCLVFHRAGL